MREAQAAQRQREFEEDKAMEAQRVRRAAAEKEAHIRETQRRMQRQEEERKQAILNKARRKELYVEKFLEQKDKELVAVHGGGEGTKEAHRRQTMEQHRREQREQREDMLR